jgi:hypothetical protein
MIFPQLAFTLYIEYAITMMKEAKAVIVQK